MFKIAHFSTLHPAHDIRIFHKECQSLQKSGYKVYLVVKNTENSTQNNINIIAINEQNNRFKRFFVASYEAYKNVIQTQATICHFHDPELIPVGILLSLRGKKVIYDVHEDLPRQILSKQWIHPILRYPVSWFAEAVEWLASRLFFSGIVPATPKIAKRFPTSKCALVQNFPKLNEFSHHKKDALAKKKKQVVYVGGVDTTRGIIENIQALDLVEDTELKMLLAGPFSSPELKSQCESIPSWKKVDYFPWLDRNEVVNILEQSIAGLVVLHPTPAYIDSLPIKMFEYMMAGIPVIASDFPLWREIIDNNHCGILVDPLKPQETADAIQWIIDHPDEAEKMGENGRKAVEEKYNWGIEEKKLLKLYKKLSS